MDGLKEILKKKQDQVQEQLSVQRKWIKHGTTSVPNLVMMDSSLSMQARFLFQCLLMHGFGKQECFPANYLLQHELGVSDRQLRRYKKELVDAGLIEIKATGRNNTYIINHQALEERADKIIDAYNTCVVENTKEKSHE